MNEVIETILEAEAKAEQILRAAEQDVRSILSQGESSAERIVVEAQARLLAEREDALARADGAAEARYDEICAEGKAQAQRLREAYDLKIQEATDKIVQKVLGR